MAAITVKYKGLTGKQDEITIDDGETLDDLIVAIAADEDISQTDYYRISLIRDFSINDVEQGDSSNTLSDLGIITGDEFLCATKQFGTKEERQIQKLDIAAAKRNEAYDRDQLPTKYSGNTVVDNANTGGLLEGRPWVNFIETSNLVVHLDAGNTDSYPGLGSTWTNLVDDTDYTITNSAFDSADGGSIVFNGSSTFVPIGTPLSAGTNYTLEAWVIDAGAGLSSRNILSTEDDVLFVTDVNVLYGGVGGSFKQVDTGSLAQDVWRHICLTFNDTTNTMVLYVNAGDINSSSNNSITQSYSGKTLRIGSHFSGGNPVSFWNGKIAQVRIYSEALTQEQVLANFNATKATYGL
jgi:hypothetical protein